MTKHASWEHKRSIRLGGISLRLNGDMMNGMDTVVDVYDPCNLADATVWCAIEPRQARLHDVAQMDLLRNHMRLSVAPFLIPELVDIELEKLEDVIYTLAVKKLE